MTCLMVILIATVACLAATPAILIGIGFVLGFLMGRGVVPIQYYQTWRSILVWFYGSMEFVIVATAAPWLLVAQHDRPASVLLAALACLPLWSAWASYCGVGLLDRVILWMYVKMPALTLGLFVCVPLSSIWLLAVGRFA